jgi:hypothetical protein
MAEAAVSTHHFDALDSRTRQMGRSSSLATQNLKAVAGAWSVCHRR